MPDPPRFCASCGAPTVTREVQGRAREICSACETALYTNPLPVAATVVLNDKREVLLVKRGNEPQKGMWCLPIGFAEMNETIVEAALRELAEEAGIVGRALRLLDASSHRSDYYGDLLIVTFEAEQVGGRECPGDDAEATGWFPLDQLPPLAFRANERAIAACRELHRDAWAIQDSFDRLQQTSAQEMLSDALITLIRDQAAEIGAAWLADVQANPTTPSYHGMNPEQLTARATTALRQFQHWLKGDQAQQESRAFYRALGAERQAGGVPLQEVLSSLTLLRKHIFAVARSQGVWERTIDVYRVLELDRRLVLFFDRAIYHTAKGFGGE